MENLEFEQMLDGFTDTMKDYISEALAGMAWVFTNMDVTPAQRAVLDDVRKQLQEAEFEMDCFVEYRKKIAGSSE